jgi:hypothetical protein
MRTIQIVSRLQTLSITLPEHNIRDCACRLKCDIALLENRRNYAVILPYCSSDDMLLFALT